MKVEVKGLTELQTQFQREAPEQMAQLSRQTLNRAAGQMRTAFVRVSTQTYTWKPAYVREHLSVVKATKSRPYAVLVGRVRASLLTRFSVRVAYGRTAKGKRRVAGIYVQVRRDAAPSLVRAAFPIGALRGSNARGTAERMTQTQLNAYRGGMNGRISKYNSTRIATGRTRVGRYPIKVHHSVSVAGNLQHEAEQLQATAAASVRQELDRRIVAVTVGRAARSLVRP